MAEEIRHPDGRIEHPEVRFEPSDASFGWIMGLLVGAILLGVVIHIAVFGFFQNYRDHLAERNRSPFPLAPGPSTALPREPRLEQLDRLSAGDQATTYDSMSAKLRSLHSYGPTKTEGFIHIPIERTMQVIVEKKMLQARPDPPADERSRSDGLIDAGASNSGRLLKGGPP